MEDAQSTEEKFETAVGIIFNNWTALKLSLEHGQGGNTAQTHTKLATLLNAIKALFVADPNLHWTELADLLGDHMDNEFDTILEDQSENEVAAHICELFKLLAAGNDGEVTSQLNSFTVKSSIFVQPTAEPVPVQSPSSVQSPPSDAACLNSDSGAASNGFHQEDEDPEWTVVKRR